MGALNKAFAPPSSYAAKRTTLWADLTDELEGCLYLAAVVEFEARMALIEHTIPRAWVEPLVELIEKRREEIDRDEF